LSLGLAIVFLMNAPQTSEQLRVEHDESVRAENAQQDWWLVSTNGYGLKQHRFYIDRDTATSMEPMSKAWIDHYEAVGSSPTLKISHDKFLAEARCEGDPQMRYRSGVRYNANGTATQSSGDSMAWMDVVPGSSMQTLWRFVCHAQPANAIVYVPDGPESDALRYYTVAKRPIAAKQQLRKRRQR
jgi:hypothetical protein